MRDAGLTAEAARRRCWFVDSRGLVVGGRTDLAPHKRPYAHDHPFVPDLPSAIEALRPTALIGVAGQPKAFSRPVLEAMARLNTRPIIFALSNPTSKAECTAEEAYTATDGRALFASGSPFRPVTHRGVTHVPGQGNNAYIFPGVGLAVSVCGITRVTDEMFYAAARTLADAVRPEDLQCGCLYPPLGRIREVSAAIAAAVAEVGYRRNLAMLARPGNLADYLKSQMFEPKYRNFE
ncbi:MAG TPA: malic enzyme-like NAD(P)-binding protein, partial [Gemmataceae bacterium]|nr:malic enzyme-like NAD(P)-binding protein [Gemmataceae bacterium]